MAPSLRTWIVTVAAAVLAVPTLAAAYPAAAVARRPGTTAGTDATWAVGGYGTGEATVVGRGIIEFNPG